VSVASVDQEVISLPPVLGVTAGGINRFEQSGVCDHLKFVLECEGWGAAMFNLKPGR
jgi:hypothetical protein